VFLVAAVAQALKVCVTAFFCAIANNDPATKSQASKVSLFHCLLLRKIMFDYSKPWLVYHDMVAG